MASLVWKYIKTLLDAIVFSSIFISLGAASLGLTLSHLLGIDLNNATVVFIFCSTFTGYNLLKLNGVYNLQNSSDFTIWLSNYSRWINILMMGAIFIAVLCLYQLNFNQIRVIGLSIILTLIYLGVDRFNLRSFWALKTPIVAFVWAFFIVGLVYFEIPKPIIKLPIIFLFTAVFLFIQGLTIPFEIRDLAVDEKVLGLKTIPMVFGLKKTKLFAVFHLVLSILFFAIFSIKLMLLFPIYLTAIATILNLRKESPEYNYTFILDGLITLVFPLVYYIA